MVQEKIMFTVVFSSGRLFMQQNRLCNTCIRIISVELFFEFGPVG